MREKEATLSVLHHLREVERRQLFARTHSSLFEYVLSLGYDSGSAHIRISAMRLLRELPELESSVEAGTLNISLLAQAQTFIRKEKIKGATKKREILQSVEGKSTRDAKRALLSQAKTPEDHLPERVRPVSETHSEVRFVIDEVLLQQLKELQARLAHSHPGAGLREVIAVAVKGELERRTPKRPKNDAKSADSLHAHEVTAQQSRPSLAEIKRIVWHRDGGRCGYADAQGKRCDSKHALEYDHLIPVALGGATTAENLQLRCRAHNRLAAIEILGPATIARHVPGMR